MPRPSRARSNTRLSNTRLSNTRLSNIRLSNTLPRDIPRNTPLKGTRRNIPLSPIRLSNTLPRATHRNIPLSRTLPKVAIRHKVGIPSNTRRSTRRRGATLPKVAIRPSGRSSRLRRKIRPSRRFPPTRPNSPSTSAGGSTTWDSGMRFTRT